MTSRSLSQTALRTAILPGIFPRLKALTKNSFGTLSFMMALLYRSVNLLPAGHPFTIPANQGRFGLKDVIVEASRQLVFSRKNMDQIFIFCTILLGLALLCAQGILLVFYLVFDTAWAQTTVNMTSLFNTAKPEKDIAFSILDQVFGIPGLFGSEYDPSIIGTLSPFQSAMHSMFAFYSYAMLMVGILIVSYYILVAIFETAQSGVPFGQRFDSVWAPLRLVVALGLLVPLGYGLNSAQYLTLYAAKYGSGFATNGWLVFWQTINNEAADPNLTNNYANPFGYMTPQDEKIVFFRDDFTGLNVLTVDLTISYEDERYRRSLISVPKVRPMPDITAFKGILETCKHAYRKMYNKDIKAFFVSNDSAGLGPGSGKRALDVTSLGYSNLGQNYKEALKFYNSDTIKVRYGIRDVDAYPQEEGNVRAYCGELKFKVADMSALNSNWINSSGAVVTPTNNDISGATVFQQYLFELTIFDALGPGGPGSPIDGGKVGLGDYITEQLLTESGLALDPVDVCERFNGTGGPAFTHPIGLQLEIHQTRTCDELPEADGELIRKLAGYDNWAAALAVSSSYIHILATEDVSISQEVLDRGWGGAAIWYNKIAEINGQLVSAINNAPTVSKMPLVMEEVVNIKSGRENAINPINKFDPVTLDDEGNEISVFRTPEIGDDPRKQQIAEALNEAYHIYEQKIDSDTNAKRKVDFFTQLITYMVGIEGIFEIRDNISVHPLAQLTSLGRSMIDAAIRNLTISIVTSVFGGLERLGQRSLGQAAKGFSGFAASFFSIALTGGVVLYYIVPFMPFMFFFFALLTWVKSIFEAMVGVPLWALAHLRIQGNGLPGQAAASGYFLIFEIFLRPILIVFGLLAASIIFFMEVYLLHITFDLVVTNVAGSDAYCIQTIRTDANELSSGCSSSGGGFLMELTQHARSAADEFFYTILYVIIIYMMATSTFKLIDAIPNSILRWMGGSTETYSDNSGDPTENLTRNAGVSSALAGRQLGASLPGMFGKGGDAGARVAQEANLFGLTRGGA